MKKLSMCFLMGFLSLSVTAFAQETLEIDYPTIKEYVTNHPTEFQELMQRFEANDSLLTRQDYATLYYGFSFTPAYRGSMNIYADFFELAKQQKYEEAYSAAQKHLEKTPISLKLLYNLYELGSLLQKDSEETRGYAKRYVALLTTISLSGDGKSEETAIKVICVADEYEMMRMFYRVGELKSQALINNCDLMKFESSEYFPGTELYFDISRSLEYTSELFNKK